MKREIGEILMTARDPAGDVIAIVSLSQGGCGIAANERLLGGCRFCADEADACADAFLRRVDPAAKYRQAGPADPPSSHCLADQSHEVAADAQRKSEAMRTRMRATQVRLRELRALHDAAGESAGRTPHGTPSTDRGRTNEW